MATTREGNEPYGGLGAGGKFRKKPYRRHQSTPYDRPPVRAPTIIPGSDGNGWLRKLMDPAHKLLATTAQKFYTTVFRKRLTQPPPPPPPPEAKQETAEKHEATSLNIFKAKEAASHGNQKQNFDSGPSDGSSMDLEEMLKHKTFTRSELDRLTALLRARVVDNLVGVEEKTPDVLPAKSSLFDEPKALLADNPVREIGSSSRLISPNAISSSVLDEDVATPAELAKAYMGSMSLKASPYMLGLRSQALAEDSTALGSSMVHSSKSPILSLVPSTSGQVGVRENGFATPRSRGRSAIYSMARTPYSRVHVTSALKGSGPIADDYGAPSSTQTSEHNRISGSSKALKRNSSIFENDIGSGGPLRRIRQKPNLSYQKNWSMLISVAGEPSSSAQKSQLVLEKKVSFAEQSNVPPVSSKSTEMAFKILEQLNKIVSPPPKERSSEFKLGLARDKAPEKLSPSKLKGKALKSLEDIDSSKFSEFAQEKNKPGSSHASGETSKEKQPKIEQNGPSRMFAASEKLDLPVNGLDVASFGKKDAVTSRAGDSHSVNSLSHSPVKKKRTFKMSAHEDYLDLEDDGYSNGGSSFVEAREKQHTLIVDHKPSAALPRIIPEKHRTITEDKPSVEFSVKEPDQGANGKQEAAQTRVDFSFPSATVAIPNSRSDLLTVSSTPESDKTASLKDSSAAPLLSSDDNGGLPKDQNIPLLTFGFASGNDFTSSKADRTPHFKFGEAAPDSRSQSSSSMASVAGGLLFSTAKVPESEKAEDKQALKDRIFSGAPDGSSFPSVSTTASATFTFGIKPSSSSNGPIVSTPIPTESNAVTSQKPSSIPSSPVVFSSNSSSSLLASSTTVTTSAPALLSFPFGSSRSNLVSQASSPTAVPLEETKTKKFTEPGNITGSSFVATNASSGVIFGYASATSNGNNQKEGSTTPAVGNGSAVIPETQDAGTGLPSFTPTAPIQFGQSSSSGLSNTVAALSSSSLFGSAAAANPFSSGTSFGSGILSSSEPGSLSSKSSGLFGHSTTAPTFTSSLDSKSTSTGFPFGSSSSSSSSFGFGPASGSLPASGSAQTFGSTGTSLVFGSTSTLPTSSTSSIFGSTVSSSASAPASVFGSMGNSSASGPASAFGSISNSSPSPAAAVFGFIGNSSASPAAPVFGSSTSSLAPSPIFGSTAASSAPTFPFTAGPPNPSSASTFSFPSAASGPSPPSGLGGSSSLFTFGSSAPANNGGTDQMSMEDSMAEDTVQANHSTTAPGPVFGQQQAVSPSPSLMFSSNAGAGAVAGASPFQFGGQQGLSTPQSPSPFQASGSLDFNAGGGSFSLGTGGGDKSGRKMVRVNRNKQRRK